MMTIATTSATHIGVGIDTARYGHRVTFLRDDHQPAARPMTITENHRGFHQLKQQLQQLHRKDPDVHFHVHLDAAGQYARNLEQFIRRLELPLTLSVGEPKRNKDYHKAFFPKQTTDDTESQAMARFGVVEQPRPTPEVPDAFFALREAASRLQGQIRDTTRATNRLHNVLARVFPELATLVNNLATDWLVKLLQKYPTPRRLAAARLSSLEKIPYLKVELAEKLQAAARNTIGSFRGEMAEALVRECAEQLMQCRTREKRLEKLLLRAYDALPASGHVHVVSIPGIGRLTAAVLVAKMISIERFATPENLVGYFGLFPQEDTSGVDRRGNKIPPGTMHMSTKGSDLVRRYLWNAAKSALRHSPAVRDLYARLRAKGTRGDVALGHCMRKLLHQVFGVWAGNTPFDEQRACSRQTTTSPANSTSDTPGVQRQTETAAGHKRDILPKRKVVTAASLSVESSAPSVNQVATDQEPSGSVDYAFLREQVTFKQLLTELGHWSTLRGSGQQRRGPCPLHDSNGEKKRDFSVNLSKNIFRCFHPECGQAGNVLDFWAAVHGLPLHDAAMHMAATFHLQIQPEQRRGTRKRKRKPR
jgi:transposase